MDMPVKYGRPEVMVPGGSSIAIGSEELEWQSDEAAILELAFHISSLHMHMPICLYVRQHILQSNASSWRPAGQVNDKTTRCEIR